MIEAVTGRSLSGWEALNCLKPLDRLKLTGKWSFTSNNGGFHFLKSECVTLSFYPSTKTSNVQGMKEKEMRDKILSLAPEETGEFVNLVDDNVNHDGGDVEGNEDDYEEEDMISQGEQGSTTTLPITEMHCCCNKNSAAIACSKALKDNQESIACDRCLLWYHFSCSSLSSKPKARNWFCKTCKNKFN